MPNQTKIGGRVSLNTIGRQSRVQMSSRGDLVSGNHLPGHCREKQTKLFPQILYSNFKERIHSISLDFPQFSE